MCVLTCVWLRTTFGLEDDRLKSYAELREAHVGVVEKAERHVPSVV